MEIVRLTWSAEEQSIPTKGNFTQHEGQNNTKDGV